MKLKHLIATALIALSCAPFAFGTDGYWCMASRDSTKGCNWSAMNGMWRTNVKACDGGIVYIDFDSGSRDSWAWAVNQDIEGLTVGGFVETADNRGLNLYVKGKDINLTGNALISYGRGAPSGYLDFNGLTLKGTSSDTVTITNSRFGNWGSFYLINAGFSGFGLVTLGVGDVYANSGYATSVTLDSVRFLNGKLEIVPTNVTDAVATSLATASGATVKAGEGTGSLILGKGSASSITLTTGPVVREGKGILAVAPKSGFSALAATEQIKPASVGGVTSGLLPPWFVAWDESAAAKPFTFLSLGSGGALEEATYTDGLAGGASSVAKLTAAATVSDDTAVKGLRLDGSGATTVTIAEGKKLTIGDGTNPAGVIINFGDKAAANPVYTAFDGGTIDFGGSEGVFWASPTTKSAGWSWGEFVDITSDIAGDGDMVFAGRARGPLPSYRFYGALKWKGDTHFYGSRFVPDNLDAFPAGTIYIHGCGRYGSAQLYLQNCTSRSASTWTITNDIHLAGIGNGDYVSYGSYEGAIVQEDYPTILSGTITLDDYASINAVRANMTFNGKITGPGGLRLYHYGVSAYHSFTLNAANDYAGVTDLDVIQPYGSVTLGENGTFGLGLVSMPEKAELTINAPAAGKVLNSPFDCKGSVYLNGGALTFPQTATFASLTAAAPVTLKVKDLAAENLALVSTGAEEGTVTAYDDDSTLTVGCDGADSGLRVELGDGDGKLSLVKRGSNTVTIYGEQKMTGDVRVEGGTLKVGPDAAYAELPFQMNATVWLDASKSDTLLCDSDGVTVTNWVSAIGDGVVFGSAGTMCGRSTKFGYPVKRTSSAWGDTPKQVLYFGTNVYARLAANLKRNYKHVFLVVRINEVCQSGMPLGETSEDIPLFRISTSATFEGQSKYMSYDCGFSSGYPTVEGKVNSTTYTYDVPQVFSVVVADGKETTRLVSIGGCRNNTNADWAWRQIGGEYAEMVAFSRALSDDERKQVEDYLSLKWRGTTIHGTTPTGFVTKLSSSSTVTLGQDGVLDLNGGSQTIAALAGNGGKVINSSDTPATLTVSSSTAFKGTVATNVTLKLAAGGTPDLLVEKGGTLATSGETTVGVYNKEKPTTEGLLYWLDAADADSLVFAADGVSVTNWTSKAPASVYFTQVGDTNKFAAPFYAPTGMNGKPALLFGTSGTNSLSRLVSNVTCQPETLFLVFRPTSPAATATGDHGIWCADWTDPYPGVCIKFTSKAQTTLNFIDGWYFYPGDTFRNCGAVLPVNEYGTTSTAGDPAQFYQLTIRRDCAHQPVGTGRNALGLTRSDLVDKEKYGNRTFTGHISEVIAYNRLLTDDEIAVVEQYLNDKWNHDGPLPTDNTTVCEDGMDFVINANGSGGIDPVVLCGSVELAKVGITFGDMTSLDKDQRHTFFQVDGTATGELSVTPPTQKWGVSRKENTWTLVYQKRGLCVIFW